MGETVLGSGSKKARKPSDHRKRRIHQARARRENMLNTDCTLYHKEEPERGAVHCTAHTDKENPEPRAVHCTAPTSKEKQSALYKVELSHLGSMKEWRHYTCRATSADSRHHGGVWSKRQQSRRQKQQEGARAGSEVDQQSRLKRAKQPADSHSAESA